jgi:trigger factor
MQDDVMEEPSAEESLAGEEGAQPKLNLDVHIDALGTCERRVRVSVPRSEIDRYFDQAVDKLVVDAVVPGFRPGRAPRKLIERRFRKEVQEQVKANLLNDSLSQLIEDYDLAPISEPELDVEQVLLPESGPMVYEFRLEVRPEFELPQWKGLELERLEHEVTEEEVEAQLQQILLRHAKLVVSDEPARAGDHVTVNIRFRLGEALLNELKDKEVKLEPRLLFRDGLLEGFDALMAGVRPGERRTGQATVSADVANEGLRGRQVSVEFEVLEVKRPQLPELNEALLERLGGYEDEGELREAIRGMLKAQFEFQQRRHIRDQIRQKLLAQVNWDLPPGLLRRQAQREIERYALELRAAGYDEQAVLAQVNEARHNILENTRRALQEHFLLERIAEEEQIAPTEEDIDQEIALIALQQRESERRVRARLEKANQMDAVYNLAVERRVIERIIAEARSRWKRPPRPWTRAWGANRLPRPCKPPTSRPRISPSPTPAASRTHDTLLSAGQLPRVPAATPAHARRPAAGKPHHPLAGRDLRRQRQRSRDEAALPAK